MLLILFIDESTSRDCIRGFPNTPVSGRDRRTNASSITALLIPGMNFTCNVTIVGFTVAGGNVFREPYSKIQIWRRNHSTYYQVEHNIFVNATSGGPVCAASRSMGSGTFTWCILQDNFRISVQTGDILGLELPDTEDDIEIYFTRGGPLNYVFSGRLGSTINNLSYNESFEKVEQLPQIMFSLTSGEVIC